MLGGGWAGTERGGWRGHPAGVLMAFGLPAPQGGSRSGKSPGGGLCHRGRHPSTRDTVAISEPGSLTRGSHARRPLGTPMWPAGQGSGPAACRAGPKGLGEARPPNHSVQRGVAASGPPKARIWGWGGPPPWQGWASGGRRCLWIGWSVGQSGCCPGSLGEPAAGGTGTEWPSPLGRVSGQEPSVLRFRPGSSSSLGTPAGQRGE